MSVPQPLCCGPGQPEEMEEELRSGPVLTRPKDQTASWALHHHGAGSVGNVALAALTLADLRPA